MPHVTFIHGISNQVPADDLLTNWEFSLSQGGLDLAAQGVTTSMVYWSDVMYPEPASADSNFESVDEGLGTTEIDEDMEWIDGLPPEEKKLVLSLRDKFGIDAKSPGDDQFAPALKKDAEMPEEFSFEAIPLPWFIKRRVMKSLLKDVHHYLFNYKHSPRAGEEYLVQDHIRALFVSQLQADTRFSTGPHVVVAHSMGTVISYDCLKNVPNCPSIDAFLTLGSPLGLSEIHNNFSPAYNRLEAYPGENIRGEWINFYDRLDPVAFDARISNDYQKNGKKVLRDQRVSNSGVWRHSCAKYYNQKILCEQLGRLLDL